MIRSYNIIGGYKILEKGFVIEREIYEYLEEEKCRRVILDREIDRRTDRIGYKNREKVYNIYRELIRVERRARVIVKVDRFILL